MLTAQKTRDPLQAGAPAPRQTPMESRHVVAPTVIPVVTPTVTAVCRPESLARLEP